MKHTEYIVPIGEEALDVDEMFIGVIRRQPELVRCKECKYNQSSEWVNCDIHPGMFGLTTDNFCSRAERKEE